MRRRIKNIRAAVTEIKRKKVNYQLIPPPGKGQVSEPYQLLRNARDQWHEDLERARIALAWHLSLKPDKDGHLVLGRCVKISDLQKEMAEWDFVIVLNREVWESSEFTRDKKLALLDHELCHAAVSEDADGELKYDERDRPVFRMRKHDIEEFNGVVKRHGCYKRDLEKFAELILQKNRTPLLNQQPGNQPAVQ